MLRILSSKSTRPPRRAAGAAAAAAFATVAAWLSQGLVTYSGEGAARIALLPLSPLSIAISVLAGVCVFWILRRGAGAAPLLLLAFVILPWLPVPLPPALMLWTGPIVLLLWIAVGLCLVVPAFHPETVAVPPALVAGAAGFILAAFSFVQVAPSVPSGDEPHYLVITQSLLNDGDLRIENNHRQRDYRTYFEGDLPPDFRVRGRNREIYSIHAPGVSALVAPAFLAGGYYGVVVFLLLLSAATSALMWHVAWRATGRADAAWFGWASVVLSATFLFHTFTVYPDGPGALAVLTGVWALLRIESEAASGARGVRPWFLHGLALAVLPWMHTRFAVLAGGLGALVLLRLGGTPNALSKAAAFLAAPVVGAVGWISYFVTIYGTSDPSAPYGGEPGSFAFVPDGLFGLFFDQRFGLLAYAPVLVFAFGGIGVMAARRGARRHALELLFVVLPYLMLVTYVAMWWGGASAPARFFMPVLPWMAIPAAFAWTALGSRAGRTVAVAALAFTAFASVALISVDGGRLAFNVRETYARWLEWLNGSVDLPRGLPVWWRERETPLFRGTAIWSGAALAGWFVIRSLERNAFLRGPRRLMTAVGLVCIAAGSAALSLTWAAEGVCGCASAPAQLAALRRLSREPRLLAVDVLHARRIDRELVPSQLRIHPEFSTLPGGAGRNDRPLFAVPAIPAGEYRLRLSTQSRDGWIMIGIGRDQFALTTQPLAASGEPVDLSFPVDVRAIMVRGDEEARRSVTAMTVEPVRVTAPARKLTNDYARRGVRYPGAVAYFMDDRSFPEPEAFWIGGAREGSVVFQPDDGRTAIALMLRNGAVENSVLVQADGWQDERRLGPGEEHHVRIPVDQTRGAVLVRFKTSAGFRPSEVDPKSRDNRFLGVWVKVGQNLRTPPK
jgi:hypothetical protein